MFFHIALISCRRDSSPSCSIAEHFVSRGFEMRHPHQPLAGLIAELLVGAGEPACEIADVGGGIIVADDEFIQ